MTKDNKNSKTRCRYRCYSVVSDADFLTETTIKEAYQKYGDAALGFAYILHDEDIYTTDEEIESEEKRRAATIERLKDVSIEQMNDTDKKLLEKAKRELPKLGDKKDAHWHVLISFTNPRDAEVVGKDFRIPSHYVDKVTGRNGFINQLAYLTHITPTAIADGKHEYDPDDVTILSLPKYDTRPKFNDIKSYADFAELFRAKELGEETIEIRILEGKLTLDEVKEKYPQQYLDNQNKYERARRAYINGLPMPNTLFNFYIGTGKKSAVKGKVGKSTASLLLALSHCPQEAKDACQGKTRAEVQEYLTSNHHVFFAGGAGVALDGYDGEDIIIWEDVRSSALVKTFGGIGRLFCALDSHPVPVNIKIMYGHVQLKNSINIFNGIEDYDEFIDGLTTEYARSIDENNRVHMSGEKKEDKSQAVGRFPFFITVTPEFITFNANFQYFIEELPNFQRTYRNPFFKIAGSPDFSNPELMKVFFGPYLECENKIKTQQGEPTELNLGEYLEEIPQVEVETRAKSLGYYAALDRTGQTIIAELSAKTGIPIPDLIVYADDNELTLMTLYSGVITGEITKGTYDEWSRHRPGVVALEGAD